MKLDVTKIAKVVADITEAAVHLTRQTTPLGMAAAATRATVLLASAVYTTEDETKNWTRLEVEFSDQLREKLAAQHPMRTTQHEGYYTQVFDVGGVALGWRMHDWGSWGPFCKQGQAPAVVRALREMLWDEQSVWRWDKTGMGANILTPEIDRALDSELSRSMWEELRQFQAKGVPRAILLYGEVGTGKSALAQNIGRLSGGRVLRIPSRTMHKVGNVLLGLELLEPSVVIVDDIDRADPEGILDVVDSLKSSMLFIATSNDVSRLDAAVYRRFDSDTEITVLPEVQAQAPEALKDLPAVYIQEFLQLKAVVGEAAALRRVPAIVSRRKRAEKLHGSGAQRDG